MTFAVPILVFVLSVGSAHEGHISAIAVSYSKGGVVILMTAEGVPLTPSIVDVASARLGKDIGLRRSSLLFLATPGRSSESSAVAITDRLCVVARDAFHNLAPAHVTEDQLLHNGSRRELTGPIRTAFKNIDLGLGRAGHYPLQIMRFGTTLTILAVGGEPSVTFRQSRLS